MITVRLAVVLAIISFAEADPSVLVHRLGAPKYADREAASSRLQKLGSEALPALRAARTVRDAEIRTRAEVLVERIESDLLVSPSLVTLDFRDRPIAEVLRELGMRGHATFSLIPGDAGVTSRRITLTSPGPVPFWSAVEELSRVGGFELVAGMPMAAPGQAGGTHPLLQMIGLPEGTKPAPTSVSGPFRVSLLNLNYHKERNFGPSGNGNNGMVGFPAGMVPHGGMAPMPVQMGGLPSVEQFQASLQILAEPRMTVTMSGPVRLSEAVDDRGNSLLPQAPSGVTFQHNSGYNRFETAGNIALQTAIGLKYPDRAGRTIKKLRGTIPVTVSARKEEPLLIALADAKGKTYHNSEISLTVHEIRTDPNFDQTTLEITVRSLDASSSPNGGMFGPEFMAIRAPGSSQNQLEIADSQGRAFKTWNLMSQMQGPDGVRMTLRVASQDGTGPPSQLRYYEMARINTDAEFEFTDVDMP
ncbi:MAG: hypothetical protein JWN86_4617 [Planctomycetota bacterium]|nr:hypothetical protein [Planctomycetota bacterium]